MAMLAVLATLACATAIDPEPGLSVLAVELSLSHSPGHLDRDVRGPLEAAVVLAVVGLVTTGDGSTWLV